MLKQISCFVLLSLISFQPVWADEEPVSNQKDQEPADMSSYFMSLTGFEDFWGSEPEDAPPPSHADLTLPGWEWGITFGNSERTNGIRFNWSDVGVKEVNGLNFTLWVPGRNPEFQMNGFTFGLLGPKVAELHGISLTGLGPVAQEMYGISFNLLAGIYGDAYGINLSGLGMGGDELGGINLAGLGIGAGNMTGLNFAGLGIGANDMAGINLAGVGMGANDMIGLNAAGFGIGANDMSGINFAGLGIGGCNMLGINAAGLGIGAENMTGINLAGLGIGAHDIAVFAKGESEPLVATGDGVREPQNRRVEILLE